MTDDENQFKQFLASVRSGDAQAAQRLVTQYESLLRREIRFRMRDSRLRRILDSGDVCQSVLASFFIRASVGQFELNEERDMLRLLITMAKRKTVLRPDTSTSRSGTSIRLRRLVSMNTRNAIRLQQASKSPTKKWHACSNKN